ncbi:MAG: HNH endonuclease [Bacilli bacterium]|jgi:hypothetical protein
MKRGTYIRTLEIRNKQSNAMHGKGLGIKRPEMSAAFMGEKNPNWGKKRSIESRKKQSISRLKKTGGIIITYGGYVHRTVFDHPMKINGYVPEHRLVVEKILGRYLKKNEVVHHIDKNKENNMPQNLMAFSSHSAHLRFEQGGSTEPDEIIFDGRMIK